MRTQTRLPHWPPPVAVFHKPVPTLANVRYGDHERDVLDFYAAPSDKLTPLVMHIPGGGWTTGDRSVILYDRYDLWQVAPDGTNPVRLTRGREDSTVYRVEVLDAEARTSIYYKQYDPSKPNSIARPNDLPQSNLTDAFTRLKLRLSSLRCSRMEARPGLRGSVC